MKKGGKWVNYVVCLDKCW